MFYSSNTPKDKIDPKLLESFRYGLKINYSKGRIPHLLYGIYEDNDTDVRSTILVLPPIQNSYFEKYDPRKGDHEPEDKIILDQLVNKLLPIPIAQVGWEGPVNEKNEPHGFGIFRYANGDIFEGEFVNGFRYYGSYSGVNGDEFKGYYNKDGRREGFGRNILSRGHIYEGEFHEDIRCGKGKTWYACGDTHEGSYYNNKQHGEGTMTYINGDIYKGSWNLDKKHGIGSFFEKSTGITTHGEWENDVLIKIVDISRSSISATSS